MILFMFGGFGPTFAPFIAIALTDGKPGFRQYRKRLFKFNAPLGYYLFTLIALLILGLIPALIDNDLNRLLSAFADTPPLLILVYFIQSFFLGGLEELGWRGYLQHQLQKKHIGIAYLLVWLTWALWHLPLFYIPGLSQSGQNFWIFGLYTLFFSLIFGWVYSRTQSIPLAVLGHTLVNVLAAIGYLNFLQTDSIHWLTMVLVVLLMLGVHWLLPYQRSSL